MRPAPASLRPATGVRPRPVRKHPRVAPPILGVIMLMTPAPAPSVPRRYRFHGAVSFAAAALALFAFTAAARAQIGTGFEFNDAPGVVFKPDGHVHAREVDPDKRLSAMRNRARIAE